MLFLLLLLLHFTSRTTKTSWEIERRTFFETRATMVTSTTSSNAATMNPREKALAEFRKKLIEHKEVEARLKQSEHRLKKRSNRFPTFSFQCEKILKPWRKITTRVKMIWKRCKVLDKYGQIRFPTSCLMKGFHLDRWRSFKTIDRRQM